MRAKPSLHRANTSHLLQSANAISSLRNEGDQETLKPCQFHISTLHTFYFSLKVCYPIPPSLYPKTVGYIIESKLALNGKSNSFWTKHKIAHFFATFAILKLLRLMLQIIKNILVYYVSLKNLMKNDQEASP